MSQDKGYSFITVGADEDDDVVIQAGAVPSSVAAPSGPSGSAAADAHTEEDTLLEEAADSQAREAYLAHKRKSEARRDAASMVTTEEDLHASVPFATMQRVILAVLLLLVVAAIVYWFFIRPLA